jgi:hypothetical protein
MTDLFGDALPAADMVQQITDAYRERLLLNPPTPSFNTNTNPNAEKFAGFASKKDTARFLAVLADMGLEIRAKIRE